MSYRFSRLLSVLAEIFRERRLPWLVEKRLHLLENWIAYLRNKTVRKLAADTAASNPNSVIAFRCGFQGNTGGAVAIAGVANLLSKSFRVVFEANPTSNFNRFLSSGVIIVSECPMDAELYICDVTCDHEFMRGVKERQKPLLVCCQGLRDALHGLDEDTVVMSLALADRVHFTSYAQQKSFNLEVEKFRVIPNTTLPVVKRRVTNNVGVVGNLAEPRKNAEATVRVGLASSADQVHLWGADRDIWNNSRVIVHPFETDREIIYDSFDCLLFLSELETFGLVVIEAMSAGIPCVLSPLPAFEHFRDTPGVVFVDPNDTEAAAIAVDQMLSAKKELSESLRQNYQNRFSDEAVKADWRLTVTELCPILLSSSSPSG